MAEVYNENIVSKKVNNLMHHTIIAQDNNLLISSTPHPEYQVIMPLYT